MVRLALANRCFDKIVYNSKNERIVRSMTTLKGLSFSHLNHKKNSRERQGPEFDRLQDSASSIRQ